MSAIVYSIPKRPVPIIPEFIRLASDRSSHNCALFYCRSAGPHCRSAFPSSTPSEPPKATAIRAIRQPIYRYRRMRNLRADGVACQVASLFGKVYTLQQSEFYGSLTEQERTTLYGSSLKMKITLLYQSKRANTCRLATTWEAELNRPTYLSEELV